MSNLLKEKHSLAKLREELEGRGKLCFGCKGFGYLVRNCKKQKETGKGTTMPQNKFEILSSRVMQCGVEERTIRNIKTVVVKCFKYEEEGHKCRWCLSWKKIKRVVYSAEGKAHQGDKREPVRLKREKAQERKLRRVEEEEVACSMKGKVQQEEWKRSSWETLRKRAEWYYGPTVPQDAELWELEWRS